MASHIAEVMCQSYSQAIYIYIYYKENNKVRGAKIKAVVLFFPKGNFFQSVSILYVL